MARQRTGTIRQRKSGVWELAASIKRLQGVTAGAERIQEFVDGLPQAKAQAKQERRYETFEGTKAEAQERLRAMQVEADRGDLPRSNITVGEWLAHWLRTYVAEHLAENTLRTYTWLVEEHIEPRIGTMKLDKVRTVDIEALLADVRKEVPGSVHLAHQAMNGAFQRAVKLEILRHNPVRNADKPKSSEKEIIPPRRAEVEAFLEAAKGHPYYALFFVLSETGLRIGEALGLRWENVHLRETGSILHVREQLFPHPRTGQFLYGTEVRRHLLPLWTAAGFPRFRLHDFRHYFASEALRRGVDLTRVSRLMGHADIATTSKLYIHLETDDLADAMAIFEAGGKVNSGPIAVADIEKLLANVDMTDVH